MPKKASPTGTYGKPFAIAAYRLGFALIALVAMGVQLRQTVADGRSVANFFSFFTIESNILAAFVLLCGSLMVLLHKTDEKQAMLRGAAALYMIMTGVIFAVLLAGLEASLQVTIPWVNTVLHYLMPLVLFADWFLAPPQRRITYRQALAWAAFPVAYLVYSLVRGAGIGWYPYPFLNAGQHGYTTVLVTSLAITAGVLGAIGLMVLPTGVKRAAKRV